jgi:hypothetical protein
MILPRALIRKLNRLQESVDPWAVFIVFIRTLASPINVGHTIGKGSMNNAIMGTAVPLGKVSENSKLCESHDKAECLPMTIKNI